MDFKVGDKIQITQEHADFLNVERLPATITKVTTCDEGVFNGLVLLETNTKLYTFIARDCLKIFATHCEKIEHQSFVKKKKINLVRYKK